MSSTDYNYDEQGQFFPFFILTVTGIVTLPLTYSLLKPNKEIENTAPRIKSTFSPKDEHIIQGQRRKQWRRERRLKRIITTIGGYLVMGLMLYLIIVTARLTPKIWDPYDILEVSRSASEKQLKKRYRDLTLQYHPDKVVLDTSRNQTIEEANEHYVELTKAYKALTDEEVRNNYVQYGHPDGKQSFSIGIALPKFIITDGNGKYVLLIYGLLLGVLLPYVVGKWWYGTQRVTKEKVLIASAGHLFQEYQDDLSDGGIINALSCGEEYGEVLKGNKVDAGLEKVEKAILQEDKRGLTVAGLDAEDKEKLLNAEGVRRKALALLWAYLGRVSLDVSVLDDEKYEIVPVAHALNEAFIAIALSYGQLRPILSAYRISQNLIQAIPPNGSPLLQLPYITPAIVRAMEKQSSRSHLTINQFMEMPEYKRRKLAADQPGTLSPSEYNAAVAVARQIPYLKIEKVFFKCVGERVIVPSAQVQLVVKARVIPPGTANIPEVDLLDLEDPDPEEGDVDAINGRIAKNSSAKPPDGEASPATSSEKELQPPLAYAPYFARDHSPRWHVFLADSKQGRLVVPPFTFATFNRPPFDTSGNPTFNVQTFKMQFFAPPQDGRFSFVMHMICDSYIGMDSKEDVTLIISDSAQAMAMEDEDDISEPDEDSIAGQMSALRTGGLAGAPPKAKKAKKHTPVDSEEDESDTEGEQADTSETDTDTDTDGE